MVILLFLVMDPIGNVPLFLSTLEKVKDERRTIVLVRELVIALVVLLAFLFLGDRIVSVLGIGQPAIAISGSIILGIISLRMIFPRPKTEPDDDPGGEPLVVPLAIPLIAGPSALATLLLLGGRDDVSREILTVALIVAWIASAAILMMSRLIRRLIGRRGLIAMERLMGMVLVAIAVQMFLDGLASHASGG